VLADTRMERQATKVLMRPPQRCVSMIFDAHGSFLLGKPFCIGNWMSGFDAKGRPIRALRPREAGTFIMPNNQGATNWYPPWDSRKAGLSTVRQDGYQLVAPWLLGMMKVPASLGASARIGRPFASKPAIHFRAKRFAEQEAPVVRSNT